MFLPHRSPDRDWLGVLIVIPEPWVTQLTELRLSLGSLQGSRVPVHITILPPTPFPIEEHPEVIRHLCEAAKHRSSFRVTLRSSGSFRPLSQVAFLSLSEGAAECANLTDKARTRPLGIEQRLPYHPYVALAQNVGDPTLDLALDLGTNFEAFWLVSGFRLNRADGDDMYSTIALFDLGASSI